MRLLKTTFLASMALFRLSASECTQAISFKSSWEILGPFQIGTREAEWGTDPLEKLGGFKNLKYDTSAIFPSALPLNGTAKWHTTELVDLETSTNATKGTVNVGYSNVDWDFLRSTYGWSGIQFQAWARGSLVICGGETTVVFYINNIGEFWIDDKQYFGGDFYGYRRAPVVVILAPGDHKIDVRVTHDIRNFGGGMLPVLSFTAEARKSDGRLVAVPDYAVVSDVVEGGLVGEWASIPFRNEHSRWVEIVNAHEKNSAIAVLVDEDLPISITAGQSRPVRFRIQKIHPNSTELVLVFQYRIRGEETIHNVSVSKPLNRIDNRYQPQKYTYLHPSGIVSYAVIRPPSPKAPCKPKSTTKLPILLVFHGAGVEADSPFSRESYDSLPDLCSWLVLASGVTSWSGDDWHRWGLVDAEAAVEAIPHWMETVKWTRQGADLQKWVISGHSNGGQGTWYALTHRNDKVIAAAPLSGYLSIPAYVPYHLWHEADPRKSAIVLASLNTYKHELLTPNMLGTPILQQHGQLDDNVPVYHSRRMHQLVFEAGWETDYLEIPGQNHWWTGAMTYGGLPKFLTTYLQETTNPSKLPNSFSVVVANPGDTGPRGSIVVDQLEEPDRFGRIDVEASEDSWSLTTSNVRRWHFDGKSARRAEIPHRVIIDGEIMDLKLSPNTYIRSNSGTWLLDTSSDWKRQERNGRQLGALDAFLGSQGSFGIIISPHRNDSYVQDIALDISRNLYQYFAADTVIAKELSNCHGNCVLLGLPDEIGLRGYEGFPIVKHDKFIELTDAKGRKIRHHIVPGMGAIFIHPLGNERLLLVIWGADEAGMRAAARLLPLRTGVGQPNFILVGKETAWSGVAGVKALGMFDSSWHMSPASYV